MTVVRAFVFFLCMGGGWSCFILLHHDRAVRWFFLAIFCLHLQEGKTSTKIADHHNITRLPHSHFVHK